MCDRIRIIIAEDHYILREGMRRLLEDSGQVEVLAAVGTAEELLAEVDLLTPDAVIADIRMPPSHSTEGIIAAQHIRAQHSHIGVVVLSQHVNETYALTLFDRGTDGLAYLLKERIGDLETLLWALREVIAGRSVVDPRIVEILLESRSRHSPLAQLTSRELQVLRHMAEGMTNRSIAEALVLSESTVEKYANSTFAKLGLSEERHRHRRVAAVLAYLGERNA